MKMRSFLSLVAAIAASGCSSNYETVCIRDREAVGETFVHRYGVEVPEKDWATRGNSGQVITTLKDGTTITRSYCNGILDGDTTQSFPHDQTIHKVTTYDLGAVVKEIINYPSGLPMQQEEYAERGGKTVTHWYESGSPLSIEKFEKDRLVTGTYYTPGYDLETEVVNGKGMRLLRDGHGALASKDIIENGEVVLRTTYHANGAPEATTPYVKGEVEGTRKTFLADGEPNTIEEWFNGKQDGTTIVFRNGEKFAEVPYVQGVKHGVEKRYKDGQKLQEEISWKDDVRQGPTRSYVGETVKTDWYHNDRPVSKVKHDQLTGRG